MTEEALKLALEALVEMTPSGQTGSAIWNKQMSAITAASDALAQPEQEPVDFASLLREAEEIMQSKPTWKRFIDDTPLANDIAVWMAVFAQDVARRTSPPQRTWVGLTDEEINKTHETKVWDARRSYARAIEAKLKEKNT
jgi:hypothetical protein